MLSMLVTQQISQCELESLKQQINVAVIKGLRSITRNVACSSKIPISNQLYSFLKCEYKLKFSLMLNEKLIDDFRIVRANFKNRTDYSKAECLRFALRKSRDVEYRSFKDGKLETTFLSPLPYLTISFVRNDKKLK